MFIIPQLGKLSINGDNLFLWLPSLWSRWPAKSTDTMLKAQQGKKEAQSKS